MTKNEMVMSALEAMGLKPHVDDDGDVALRYQMKNFYVLCTQDEDRDFLVVMLPQFYEISEGDEVKVLAVCNKVTRDVSLVKVFVDQTLKNVTATCEFYYSGEDGMRCGLEHSLKNLGMIRSTFYKELRDMSD